MSIFLMGLLLFILLTTACMGLVYNAIITNNRYVISPNSIFYKRGG